MEVLDAPEYFKKSGKYTARIQGFFKKLINLLFVGKLFYYYRNMEHLVDLDVTLPQGLC